jgi:hypothetical protein
MEELASHGGLLLATGLSVVVASVLWKDDSAKRQRGVTTSILLRRLLATRLLQWPEILRAVRARLKAVPLSQCYWDTWIKGQFL